MVHAENSKSLPFHHNDPFDQMIISLAIMENLQLMSYNKFFKMYEVNLLS